jgi:hypothetical protein
MASDLLVLPAHAADASACTGWYEFVQRDLTRFRTGGALLAHGMSKHAIYTAYLYR